MTTPIPAGPPAPTGQPAPAAPPTPPAAPAPAPSPAQQPAPPTAPPAPTPPTPDPQTVESLPQWAQQLIKGTRAEAADWRTRYQQTQQPAPAAPPTPPDPTPAPVQPAPAAEGDVSRLPRWAQTAVTGGQDAARQLSVQSAVIAAAPAAGADLAAVLDSTAAMTALAAVDPADPAAVTAALTAAVQANPRLRAHAGPPIGGADFTTTGPQVVTAERFAAMPYAERVALHQSDPETYRRLAGS
ncbi:hypothetical protein ACSMX9_22610 [Streptomyces sp. LE64]|uniref:hypothetical protein n=1 Tax=Streptomyces sp. LE64 TaxID=3448653 RepID=UPI0040410760